MSLKEQQTDNRTGMDAAEKFKAGDLPKPEDGYMSKSAPGSSSLQDRSMNQSMAKNDPMVVEALEKGNPLPEPKTGESQNEFVSRCMQKLSEEDSSLDRDQRLAACFDKFRD